MRGLFVHAFIIAGIMVGGSSSFAVAKQYSKHTSSTSTGVTEVSYLGSSYNAFFLPNNEAYSNGGAIIHFSRSVQVMDTMLNPVFINMLEKNYLLYSFYFYETYIYNTEWRVREDNDSNVAVLDYSRRIGPDTMLLIGFVHKQKLKKSKIAKTVGLGIHHQLTPLIVCGIGTGVGIDKEFTDFRVTAGIQFSF
ncbi:MAG: hypothetical protein L0Y68_09635 [Candidatus Dadabacteria bacterium]|nr:hypothetical protein [Candidatus Dadabacteria bacterium]